MIKPTLLLVNGIPGSGKTTLSHRLAKDLDLPRIGKDDIKELLFDRMGIGDLAWSQDLGAATADMLFALIETLARRRRTILVESAFFKSFAGERIASVARQYPELTVIEVYCHADEAVRRQRFIARVESGERHPGHADQIRNAENNEEIAAKYAPLNVGTLIMFDTTEFDDTAYANLLRDLRALLIQPIE